MHGFLDSFREEFRERSDVPINTRIFLAGEVSLAIFDSNDRPGIPPGSQHHVHQKAGNPTWMAERFGVVAHSAQRMGLRDARDQQIFEAAREAGAVVMTKDIDFVRLLELHGPPPQVLWVTLGNTSNSRMRNVLERTFSRALELLESGEPLVEISDS